MDTPKGDSPEIKFVRTQIQDIRAMMKGERDFRIRTTPRGGLSVA